MTCNNPTDHICRKSKVAGSRTVAVLFRQFTRANQCKFGPIIRTSWGKYEIKVSFRFLAARRPSSILHFNPTIMHRSKPGFKLAWNSLLNGIVQGKHRSSPKLPPCTQPPKASRMRNYSKIYDRKSMSCNRSIDYSIQLPWFRSSNTTLLRWHYLRIIF